MHVTGFTWTVSVNWSVSVSIFRFECQFQFSILLDYCYRFQSMVTLAYLSLSYAPWSEGGCLSSAKLRSTDSVNPRAVLSRVLPRYRPLLCVTSSSSRCLVLVRPTVTRRLVLGHIYDEQTQLLERARAKNKKDKRSAPSLAPKRRLE